MSESWCYAEGTRGITCDYGSRSTFSDSKGELPTIYICKRHYDILAEIQGKPSFEERQQLRVAGKYRIKHSPLIPYREWWDKVLLPSYRTERFILNKWKGKKKK